MDLKVLIIDDNEKIRAKLSEYFMMNNIDTFAIEDGNTACEAIAENKPDIVILDILLPGKDGFEVLRDIREKYSLPVIMLTAKGEETDRIVGLEMGADDYLTKPFNARELLARIRAVIRRSRDAVNTSPKTMDGNIYSGDLFLNVETQTLFYKKNQVLLTSMEFKLMKSMMKHPNRIFLRDELMTIVSGMNNLSYDRSIDAHISRLRTKIGTLSGDPKLIKTIHGRGYMLIEKTKPV